MENEHDPNSPLPSDENPSIPEVIVSPLSTNFSDLILKMLDYGSLCLECLGRQFSYLGTATDNSARAEALLLQLVMECHYAILQSEATKKFTIHQRDPLEILKIITLRTRFLPAKRLYEKILNSELVDEEKFDCRLCRNILLPESILKIAESAVEAARGYEFDHFLIGTGVDPTMADKEDEFRARFNLQTGEAFKANLNRLVGKQLNHWWAKPVQYTSPDLMFVVQLHQSRYLIDISSNSLFLKARYQKLVRNIPQTRWDCYECHGHKRDRDGNICTVCNGTGLMYPESIESLVGNPVLEEAMGTDVFFHGAGREDFDARCLGEGRPFIVEVRSPKRRYLDFLGLSQKIEQSTEGRIKVTPFELSTKAEVVQYKNLSEFLPKIYQALVYTPVFIDEVEFNAKLKVIQEKIINKVIKQRTPNRVVHRRADKTRDKQVFAIEGKFLDPVHCWFEIKTQGGTYIKELISGDEGRTTPSFSAIFERPMTCVELDIIEVENK